VVRREVWSNLPPVTVEAEDIDEGGETKKHIVCALPPLSFDSSTPVKELRVKLRNWFREALGMSHKRPACCQF
jgi:hypothetical protein